MTNKPNKTPRSVSGQAIVEMALVLPLFIFMILGIFDFSRAFHAWSNLNYQCTRAARLAARRINPLIGRNIFSNKTHTESESVREIFWQFRSPLMATDNYLEPEFAGVGNSDRVVEVRAGYRISLYTPLIGKLISDDHGSTNSILLRAATQERKE